MDARSAESLLEFAERAVPELRGMDAKAVFAALERPFGDLVAGMGWL